jgi:anti-sigma regulatory factor (Ser/Thr protein kinase)
MDRHAQAQPGAGGEAMDLPRDPATLSATRRTVQSWAGRAGLGREGVDDLVLAVSEAATNAIVHSRGPMVHIRLRATEDQVVVEISDEGVFRPSASVDRDPATVGRGLPLLLALVDEVTFAAGTERRPGTRVRLVKAVDHPG